MSTKVSPLTGVCKRDRKFARLIIAGLNDDRLVDYGGNRYLPLYRQLWLKGELDEADRLWMARYREDDCGLFRMTFTPTPHPLLPLPTPAEMELILARPGGPEELAKG